MKNVIKKIARKLALRPSEFNTIQNSPSIKEVVVNIDRKKYLIMTDDNYLNGRIEEFEPDMVKLFKALASNSKLILDIGANIGCTALLFGNLAQNVYAFEPSPSTYSFLDKNIKRSGLKNIHVKNIGLGLEAGETTITFDPLNRAGGFVSNQTQASAGHITEKIVINTLDEIVKSIDPTNLDFIKIDVEGFEGQVIKGAENTISKYKPVIVLELNHWCLNAFQRTSLPDFFDFLRSKFPLLLAVDGNGYLDLNNESDRYVVMYYHIMHMRFPNLIAAFDEKRLEHFRSLYQKRFIP